MNSAMHMPQDIYLIYHLIIISGLQDAH